jgi:hypothetical protein
VLESQVGWSLTRVNPMIKKYYYYSFKTRLEIRPGVDPGLGLGHGSRWPLTRVNVKIKMTIVLKPGPAWRVDPLPGRPGAGTGPSWRKKEEEKLGCNPLTFFLLKRCHFDLKKKIIDLGDTVIRSKPRPWTGASLKTIKLTIIIVL